MKFFGTKLSRRTLFQNAGVVAGVGLLGLNRAEGLYSQSPAGAAMAPGQPRALALIGDRFHNPDYIRVSLDRVFKELNIPIDYTIEYDKISASVLKNYQLFLCLRDGMIWPGGYLGPDAWSDYSKYLENAADFPSQKTVAWMTEDQGTAIKDFVNAGNGFYALHNSSHISLSSKNYREVMGGAYISHPPLRPFRVRPTENKHPITEGITEFMVNDEQHYVTYDKDPKYVLLEAENVDGLPFETYGTKSISAWAYDFGSGRVVFTAVGHTNHAMWAPQYLEIQKRSVRWLLKRI
jgi:type 1 glutamine amidotransferase